MCTQDNERDWTVTEYKLSNNYKAHVQIALIVMHNISTELSFFRFALKWVYF